MHWSLALRCSLVSGAALGSLSKMVVAPTPPARRRCRCWSRCWFTLWVGRMLNLQSKPRGNPPRMVGLSPRITAYSRVSTTPKLTLFLAFFFLLRRSERRCRIDRREDNVVLLLLLLLLHRIESNERLLLWLLPQEEEEEEEVLAVLMLLLLSLAANR